MTGLLPWHRALWRHTAARLQAGRMPHALLLGGPRGIGKHRFAEHLARAALCEAPDAQGGGCGQCRQCHLTLAGTHPDWRQVSPEEEGKDILVDQVRELTQHLGLKAQMGGYKVAVIEPADKMNMNAANCLLKSLEEPPAATQQYGVMILLVITDSYVLLSAIATNTQLRNPFVRLLTRNCIVLNEAIARRQPVQAKVVIRPMSYQSGMGGRFSRW